MVLQNPNGILFDTLSVCRTLNSYIEDKKINEDNLFFYNELWQSWQYHSIYAGLEKSEVLVRMNESLQKSKFFFA